MVCVPLPGSYIIVVLFLVLYSGNQIELVIVDFYFESVKWIIFVNCSRVLTILFHMHLILELPSVLHSICTLYITYSWIANRISLLSHCYLHILFI